MRLHRCLQAVKGLSKRERSQHAKHGGVIALVYLAAILLPADLDRSDLFKTGLQPVIWAFDNQGTYTCIDPANSLYGDLSQEEAAHWASQLVPKTAASATGPVPSYDAWRDIPSYYLCCENDKAVPLEMQRHMLSLVEARGVSIQVETCSAGHSPCLSQPDVVVALIDRAAKSNAA